MGPQVIDARDPLTYRSTDLEDYARDINDSKASLLLLNKSDLLPEGARTAWADYLDGQGIAYIFWSAKLAAADADDASGAPPPPPLPSPPPVYAWQYLQVPCQLPLPYFLFSCPVLTIIWQPALFGDHTKHVSLNTDGTSFKGSVSVLPYHLGHKPIHRGGRHRSSTIDCTPEQALPGFKTSRSVVLKIAGAWDKSVVQSL